MIRNSIEVRNFTKKFGDFVAVDNISFDVEEGTVFGFLGPNGAGKSTTINTLCTIQGKSEGSLKINGYDVNTQKNSVRNEIGIVFQESTLDGKLTVEENLKLHCVFYNVPKKEIRIRINFVLGLIDLEDRRNSVVNSLSGGMKRRVEIARGLVHFPKVLFLDEPTAGLDPQTRANVWEYIYKLQKQKNITIFLTTHYLDEAEICHKVAIIDKGRIIAHDTPLNLKKQYTSSTLKIETSDLESATAYLNERNIKFKVDDDRITIFTKGFYETQEITTDLKSIIEDIEISKGTLNDVFLAITGREIRE